ncbi:MAG TPA: MEDS domain-containing protein, partial [Nitrososphaera sp.]|nr:MEDS domain-containing protein [Nitrososphaera sp.]
MEYNQLLDFIDNLDTIVHRHLVMFYEEPEYAKLVQMRFINTGLKKGECCIYVVNDEQDLLFIRREMIAYGIDVDQYGKRGLLHLHVKRVAKDLESFKHSTRMICEGSTKKFLNHYSYHHHHQQQQRPPKPPPIRAVGLAIPHVLPEEDSSSGGGG